MYYSFTYGTRAVRYNCAIWRTHQASDIAKLRFEPLSLLELIAYIGCAVAEQ